jgi:hypothetical protein
MLAQRLENPLLWRETSMKKPHTGFVRSLLLAATLTFAGLAYAQQPPDVVASDAYNNTASGSNVLLNMQPRSGEINNSAIGEATLYDRKAAGSNAATGQWAPHFEDHR